MIEKTIETAYAVSVRSPRTYYHLYPSAMPVFAALGIGLLIVILQSLSPSVLHQGETTVISVLHAVEVAATTAASLTASASFAPLFDPPVPISP